MYGMVWYGTFVHVIIVVGHGVVIWMHVIGMHVMPMLCLLEHTILIILI